MNSKAPKQSQVLQTLLAFPVIKLLSGFLSFIFIFFLWIFKLLKTQKGYFERLKNKSTLFTKMLIITTLWCSLNNLGQLLNVFNHCLLVLLWILLLLEKCFWHFDIQCGQEVFGKKYFITLKVRHCRLTGKTNNSTILVWNIRCRTLT